MKRTAAVFLVSLLSCAPPQNGAGAGWELPSAVPAVGSLELDANTAGTAELSGRLTLVAPPGSGPVRLALLWEDPNQQGASPSTPRAAESGAVTLPVGFDRHSMAPQPFAVPLAIPPLSATARYPYGRISGCLELATASAVVVVFVDEDGDGALQISSSSSEAMVDRILGASSYSPRLLNRPVPQETTKVRFDERCQASNQFVTHHAFVPLFADPRMNLVACRAAPTGRAEAACGIDAVTQSVVLGGWAGWENDFRSLSLVGDASWGDDTTVTLNGKRIAPRDSGTMLIFTDAQGMTLRSGLNEIVVHTSQLQEWRATVTISEAPLRFKRRPATASKLMPLDFEWEPVEGALDYTVQVGVRPPQFETTKALHVQFAPSEDVSALLGWPLSTWLTARLVEDPGAAFLASNRRSEAIPWAN